MKVIATPLRAAVESRRGCFAVLPALFAGRFVYVTDDSTTTVAAYSIASTGKVTPVPNSPFATGSLPIGVVVDQTGTFVYVVNSGGNSVSGYRIGSNGTLSPLSGSPFPTGSNPYRLTVAP